MAGFQALFQQVEDIFRSLLRLQALALVSDYAAQGGAQVALALQGGRIVCDGDTRSDVWVAPLSG